MLLATAALIVGPKFGSWLCGQVQLSGVYLVVWPYIQLSIAAAFAIIAVGTLYFVGPNIKQRFRTTLPGAVLAVCCWLGLSSGLGIYFHHFGTYNKTYGTLGAAIALMVWLDLTGLAMLAGAEFNAQLNKLSKERELPLRKSEARSVARIRRVV